MVSTVATAHALQLPHLADLLPVRSMVAAMAGHTTALRPRARSARCRLFASASLSAGRIAIDPTTVDTWPVWRPANTSASGTDSRTVTRSPMAARYDSTVSAPKIGKCTVFRGSLCTNSRRPSGGVIGTLPKVEKRNHGGGLGRLSNSCIAASITTEPAIFSARCNLASRFLRSGLFSQAAA